MRLLLPPSESKAAGGRGRALLRRPPHPTLGPARSTVLAALTELAAGDRAVAARALLLPPAVVDAALAANARADLSPTMPALRRYTGVVYEGLGFADLDPAEQRVAARCCYVFSGLLGVVRGDEAVPDYRLPAKGALPGVGVVGTFWRTVLDHALPTLLGRGAVIDLRSSDYSAMWRAPPARGVITVRVHSPVPSGGYAVVSHPSKLAKGRLAAALVRRAASGVPVRTAQDVADTWLAAGGPRAELDAAYEVVIYTGAAPSTRARR